jgi:hypothetical protein
MAGSKVLTRLRAGVAKEEMRPAFDRVSALVYIIAIPPFVVTAGLFLLLGFSADLKLGGYYLIAFWPWLGGVLAKRVGHPRLGGAAEMIGLIYALSLTAIFATMALSEISMPFSDRFLAGADRYLRFDWISLARLAAPHETLITLMTAAYRSVGWQPAVVISILFAQRRGDRARALVAAWGIGLIISCTLYPIFTAEGPFAFYKISPQTFPNALSDDPWRFGPIISSIRDHGVRHMSEQMLTGLITFPSFHAAAAVFLGWAIYPVRLIRSPIILLNVAMFAATLLCGSHYLIDLVGGIVVAFLGIVIAKVIYASA